MIINMNINMNINIINKNNNIISYVHVRR